jgi:large subunit ribosomal protein L10
MPKTREQKEKIIDGLKKEVKKQKAMFLLDFAGLKTKDLLQLKRNLKGLESVLRICKKTLLRLALKREGLTLNIENIKGQLAVIFCFGEALEPAKALYQFCQVQENMKIIGCFLENELRDKDYLTALAQIPSRQELLARVVRSISSPISSLLNVLQGNIKGLIYVLAKAKT